MKQNHFSLLNRVKWVTLQSLLFDELWVKTLLYGPHTCTWKWIESLAAALKEFSIVRRSPLKEFSRSLRLNADLRPRSASKWKFIFRPLFSEPFSSAVLVLQFQLRNSIDYGPENVRWILMGPKLWQYTVKYSLQMLWWSVCLSTIDNGYHSQYSNNVIDTIKTINIETILGSLIQKRNCP